MDYGYMGELLLSVVIFAPGVALLAMCAFIGVLVMLEKSGVLGLVSGAEERQFNMQELAELAANPPEGRVVAGVHATIEEEAAGQTQDVAQAGGQG